MIDYLKHFFAKEEPSSKSAFGDFFKHASPQHKKAVFTRVMQEVNQEQREIVRQYGQRRGR